MLMYGTNKQKKIFAMNPKEKNVFLSRKQNEKRKKKEETWSMKQHHKTETKEKEGKKCI